MAIAVRSLDEALALWRDQLGLELAGLEEVPTEKVRVAILKAGAGRIELMEPTAADSPIAAFLDKRGGGLHHVALRVDDVSAASQALAGGGCPLIGAAARPGAHGTLVSFLHPRGTGGVLVELVEEHG
ncbi:MAG: methylmalonyl-CoA epimerase [Candidatus Eisenbacteria bacterium]